MRRTQLYLDEPLWEELNLRARQEKTTVSELVRGALRERYCVPAAKRRQAMLNWMGIWRHRDDLPPTEDYVRRLREDDRQSRLEK